MARTGGQLTPADRRALFPALARAHAVNAVGRLTMLARLNSGRRAEIPRDALRQPSSVLTVAAEREAIRLLTPALLNHSYRTYLFGVAVGSLEGVDVDREVLFAAALLHDTGLRHPVVGVDFTAASAAHALRVAEEVGLSTAATQVMRSAITLHHSPDVTLGVDGPVAYLLSAGAALDVMGMRSWKVPPVPARRGGGPVPAVGVQAGVHRRVRRRVCCCAGRACAPAAPVRRVRPGHQARPVPRVTAPIPAI